jgi:glycosyltransferase involved in cell wall biosynthesis
MQTKVLFLLGGLTHYYNRVLSRLNEEPGIEILGVTAAGNNSRIGEAVYETMDGANFRICRLKEFNFPPLFTSYSGLSKLLWLEKPDIVVVPDNSILNFLLDPRIRLQLVLNRIKIVQQAIPFNVRPYQQAVESLDQPTTVFDGFPHWSRALIAGMRMKWLLRWSYLQLKSYSYRWVDAHLNYIDDAKAIYGSYGVPEGRVFVTLNSPDTDYYKKIETEISGVPLSLPPNRFRLIHVGRLVQWKRVDVLIEAVAILKKTFSEIELIVVGSGPEEQCLKNLSANLGILESIRFVGGVYDARLLGAYLSASAIYVLAGMGGLSINDAMFFKKPVVCSVCDGTEKALVREGVNGAFFEEGNVLDLVAKLSNLLMNPSALGRMGLASRRIIDEEVNIGTVCDRYLSAFAAIREMKSS